MTSSRGSRGKEKEWRPGKREVWEGGTIGEKNGKGNRKGREGKRKKEKGREGIGRELGKGGGEEEKMETWGEGSMEGSIIGGNV